MRVNKAKRRLLKWERYTQRSVKASPKIGLFRHSVKIYHNGHAKAHWDVMTAKRYFPVGLRCPYLLRKKYVLPVHLSSSFVDPDSC